MVANIRDDITRRYVALRGAHAVDSRTVMWRLEDRKVKPSLELCGKEVRIDKRLVRVGFLDGEGYQFLDDPESCLESLRKSDSRIDLFTFIQKLSDASPKYSYPM